MSIEIITLLMFGSLLLLIALGLPISFVLGGVALVFGYLLWGPASLNLVVTRTLELMRTVTLVAVPLFIFMASVLERSGIAEDLYDAMYRWAGPVRGGLAAGTVLICTVMAAMSGVAATATVSMGLIALPAMVKRGYDKKMCMGCIMAGGALGPLIPPSVIMVVYASLIDVSIGKLFAGGVFPGLLLSFMFICYILIRCFLNPGLGPALPVEERINWKAKFTSLRMVILPVLLIVGVLGSIFLGLATPTEAAAVGCFGSVICAVIHRRFNWGLMKDSAIQTMRVSGMIMWIILTGGLFAKVFQGLGAKQLVIKVVTTLHLGWWGTLIGMQLIWLVLGCMMESSAILLISYPVIASLIDFFGYNSLWFGILFVVNANTGYQTPPFGANLFYMKGIAPKGTRMDEIYRSVIPYVVIQVIGLVIFMLFPSISTWLPSVIMR